MKINIKGPIISNNDQWIYDWFGIEAVSPSKVSKDIEKAGNSDLEVEINSGGGSVFDASEIYTMLKSHPGNVITKIVGIAASAASVIAMAGTKVMMSPTGQMMIHNASARVSGDYRSMDNASSFLKNVNQTIANAYSLKSGKPYNELLSMMDQETWLTPQQAFEHNLIDEIMFEGQGVAFVASADGGMLPQEVIEKIRNKLGQEGLFPNASINKKEEEEDLKTLEELKNKYPDLYNQARQEGVLAENQRIKGIEDLGSTNKELVNQAKFEKMLSPQDLAMELVMSEKKAGEQWLESRGQDAANLNGINGSYAPDYPSSDKSQATADRLSSIMNNFRGGVK